MTDKSELKFTITDFNEGLEPLVIEFFDAMGGETRALFNRRGYNLRGALRACRTEDKTRKYIAFLSDEKMIGYAFFLDYDKGVPELGLAVRDDMRGMGIGRSICTYAIEHARREGFGGIYLTTHLANVRAQALYEKLGFKLIGPAKDGSELAYLLKLSR